MQSPKITIGRHVIGDNLSPYVIAEIGVNHEGDLDLARRLIDEAKAGGAHAAKFQSYKAGKIASRHSPAYWDTSKEPTESQYRLFSKYDAFEPEHYRALAEHCRQTDIDFLSTPFDLEAVDFLEPLMPLFKIASADITNVPLIRKCAQTGKPLVISTGASSVAEIRQAVDIARRAGATRIVLLHCVLNYPTSADDASLGMIHTLAREFPDCLIGYSDHVVPDKTISALEAAMLLGACVLEKHFTHDKTLPGNDHYHAMDRYDLAGFMKKAEAYRSLIGDGSKDLDKEQAARLHARRSIVASRRIGAGQAITGDDLIAKRPAHGISPLHWDDVIGARALCDIEEDTLLQWDMIDTGGGNE